MKIIHIADLHLNGGEESVQCFHQAIDYAISNSADLILCAGDVYDNRTPPPEFKDVFHRTMRRVSDAGIPCIIIVGNHDKSPSQVKVHALEEFDSLTLPNIKVYNEFTIDSNFGVEVVAVPWLYNHNLPELPPKSGVRVGCVHASIEGCIGIGDRPIHFGEKEFLIPPKYFESFDYVAMGHIHKPQTIGNCVYPGSAGILNWGEANDPPHGFVEITVSDTVTWQHIPYTLEHRWIDLVLHGNNWDEISTQWPTDVNPEWNYRLTIYGKPNNYPILSPRCKIRYQYESQRRQWVMPESESNWDVLKAYLGDDADEEIERLFREIEESCI